MNSGFDPLQGVMTVITLQEVNTWFGFAMVLIPYREL